MIMIVIIILMIIIIVMMIICSLDQYVHNKLNDLRQILRFAHGRVEKETHEGNERRIRFCVTHT